MMTTTTADQISAYVDALNDSRPATMAAEPFAAVTGRRYVKVCRMSADGRPTSVHAFIDPAAGLVFKPAGWAAPAKGARYDLGNPASFTALLLAAGGRDAFAGGYLYR
jgi:hypothetical protein